MTTRSWHWYLVLQVVWWTWTVAWSVLYVVFGLWRNPEWYSMLLAINLCMGVLMSWSYRRTRRLHEWWLARDASLQEDLRVYIEQERWSRVDLTLDLMTIWNVTPKTEVPDHPGLGDDGYWSSAWP